MTRWRHLLTVLAVVGLAVGCRPTPDDTEPASGPQESHVADRPGAPGEPHLDDDTERGELFVAPLASNRPFDDALPATWCVDGVHYVGSPLRLGRVNLVGDDLPVDVAPGSWAIVRGQLHAQGWFERLESGGPCPDDTRPDQQWRGDWTADEGGYQTTRAALEAAPWLEVESVTVLDGAVLEIERPAVLEAAFKRGRRGGALDDAALAAAVVRVQVRNPFDDRDWRGVELRAGYESVSHGKPMPFYERRTLTLAPGETVTVELPARIERHDGQVDWAATFSRATLHGGRPRALGDPLHADD